VGIPISSVQDALCITEEGSSCALLSVLGGLLFLLSVGSKRIVISIVGLFLLSGLLVTGFVPGLVLCIP
jgi:hypothetical protein